MVYSYEFTDVSFKLNYQVIETSDCIKKIITSWVSWIPPKSKTPITITETLALKISASSFDTKHSKCKLPDYAASASFTPSMKWYSQIVPSSTHWAAQMGSSHHIFAPLLTKGPQIIFHSVRPVRLRISAFLTLVS